MWCVGGQHIHVIVCACTHTRVSERARVCGKHNVYVCVYVVIVRTRVVLIVYYFDIWKISNNKN